MILTMYILIEIILLVILVFLSRLAVELRRESKRGIRLPTGVIIEKDTDKTVYRFQYEEEHKYSNENG